AAAAEPLAIRARGIRGILSALVWGLRARVSAATLFAPLLVFALVLLFAMPFALLSPKEFGYGLGQVFFAQGANRRALPPWISIEYLYRSVGPLCFALVAGGLLWGLVRLRHWDAS